MPATATRTVWVLADQLDVRLAHLAGADPATTTVLMIVSRAKVRSAPWHRQRLHLILTAMRRFALDLEARGFTVDWRVADDMTTGLEGHLAGFAPSSVTVMEPMNRTGQRLMERLAERHPIEIVRSDQFLCHRDEFATWADSHVRRDGSVLLEDFYRWQRRRLDILMEPDGEPVGGRWNLDHDNRLPPPADGGAWPDAPVDPLDEVDAEIAALIDAIAPDVVGAPPDGTWATSRAGALARLDHFGAHALSGFGPYEDAIVSHHWHLNHSMLSPYLNLGMLHPSEVVDAVVAAGRERDLPLNSIEGFVRQMIGWREYVHGVYWWRGAEYATANHFGDTGRLPPAFTGASTDMNCVAHTASWVHDHGWTHHIPRLMVLANLATLAGVEPAAMVRWMWASFVDGAEWVMVPNVIGMGMYADGGSMSTKPYVAGGNYMSKMTDFCRGCAFDRSARTGDRACPFTTLYWDFLDRHRDRLGRNNRLAQPYANLRRLADVEEVRARAVTVRSALSAGTL
jgi:deoxyribodipyrimidine photolyase-related protein